MAAGGRNKETRRAGGFVVPTGRAECGPCPSCSNCSHTCSHSWPMRDVFPRWPAPRLALFDTGEFVARTAQDAPELDHPPAPAGQPPAARTVQPMPSARGSAGARPAASQGVLAGADAPVLDHARSVHQVGRCWRCTRPSRASIRVSDLAKLASACASIRASFSICRAKVARCIPLGRWMYSAG